MTATIPVPTLSLQPLGMLMEQNSSTEGRRDARRAKLALNQTAHIPLMGETDVAWI